LSSLTESGGFLRRNYLVIFVSLAYAEAAVIPFMDLKWNSPFLVFWSALLLALLTMSFFKLLQPVAQARADLCFVVCLILALDLFSVLLGPDSHWLQPMNYVLIALCAVYYSLGFNFIVAALIFILQLVGVFSARPEPGSYASLAVFGAYLLGTAIILGRLFQSEQKKKEKAMLAVRRIHEGAAGLTTAPGEEQQLSSISPQGRFSSLVESAAELDRVLKELLLTVRSAIPCDNALLFMATEDEGRLYLRLYIGTSELADSPEIAMGQGLTGWVAKEKKPVLVKDGARGLGYLKDEREVNSFLAVPIMNGGFLEGVIALDTSTGSFSEKDKESLTGFASLALHVLRSARAYQQVDMSAKEFEALHRISAELSSSLDLKTILEKLATCSREIIAYDYMTVSFVEGPDTAAFRILKGYDGLKIPEGPVPLAGSLLGWIVENRQELCFTDLDQRAQKLPVFPDGMLKTEFKSFLGIPFLSQEACMGVFTVAMRAPGAITAYQHHTLSIIANQVAVNISNARFHQMMERMATTDGLTGLTNHRAFQEKADQEFERAQRYPQSIALLLFDIDHFKKINDSYGHPVGDAVLKKIGKLLNETVRVVDVAARYGGEEFVALLVNTDSKGASQMAERIRSSIEKSKFLLNGQRIPVTVSVGYAVFPEDAKEKSGLIEMADQALYAAKDGGRNQCRAYRDIAATATSAR
jgi:two-component system cell cycle response regulator